MKHVLVVERAGASNGQFLTSVKIPSLDPQRLNSILLDTALQPESDGPDEAYQRGQLIHARLDAHPEFGGLMSIIASVPQPLIVELVSPEAEDFPWELLPRSGPGKEFLALDPERPIIRWPSISPSDAEPVRRMLTSPVRVAAVLGAKGIDANPEWDALEAAITQAGLEVDLRVWTSDADLADRVGQSKLPGQHHGAVIPHDKAELLWELKRHRPQLLHVFAHGSPLAAAIEIETKLQLGECLDVTATDLGELAPDLWLATFSACQGASGHGGVASLAASFVLRGAPAAIGMRTPITQYTAHRFGRALTQGVLERAKQALATGLPEPRLDWGRTLLEARRAVISKPGTSDAQVARDSFAWSSPALYMRPDGLTWQVPAAGKGAELEKVLGKIAEMKSQLRKGLGDRQGWALAKLEEFEGDRRSLLEGT